MHLPSLARSLLDDDGIDADCAKEVLDEIKRGLPSAVADESSGADPDLHRGVQGWKWPERPVFLDNGAEAVGDLLNSLTVAFLLDPSRLTRIGAGPDY